MKQDLAIKVEGISKKYAIGTREAYLTLRDRLMELPKRIFKKEKPKEFWALNDVSFEVKRGEVVGIIGRNGAGKSTLLKILARITEPTTGKVTMRGRVASMLEVGTGFNPELTGRENIYLNGAILGMSRREIEGKFKEIIDFSGVEKFIDTPVKHYSSGMYVRLAFAVAAHLDTDILLVDEVLAVGDAEFQKKCLGKIGDLSQSGRTIVFISHNSSTIRSLCSRVIHLEKGNVISSGSTEKVLSEYINQHYNPKQQKPYQEKTTKSKPFQVLSLTLTSGSNKDLSMFDTSYAITANIKLKLSQSYPDLYGYLTISNQEGVLVLEADSLDTGINIFKDLSAGTHNLKFTIPPRSLVPGIYNLYLNFSYFSGNVYPYAYPGIVSSFQLHDSHTRRGNNRRGYVGSIINWEKI